MQIGEVILFGRTGYGIENTGVLAETLHRPRQAHMIHVGLKTPRTCEFSPRCVPRGITGFVNYATP